MALVCAMVLVIGSNGGVCVQAAKKPVSLSKTSIVLKEGNFKTIKVKKAGKVKIKKKAFKSTNKKVATVTKKGKVAAKKAGKATIKVTVKYLKGRKVKSVILKCKIKVTNKGNRKATADPSKMPASTSPSEGQNPTKDPVVSATPSAMPDDLSKAGLYDSSGNRISAWKDLLEEDDVRVEDGVLTHGSNLSGKLVIEDGVTSIGYEAFWTCSDLTGVIIPDSATENLSFT